MRARCGLAIVWAGALSLGPAACGGGGGDSDSPDAGWAGGGGGTDDLTGPLDASALRADALTSRTVATSVITQAHRYIAGSMFGGWGPHLGHLVRTEAGALLWVDDGCEQSGGQPCDVNTNHRVDYYELAGGAWELRATQALTGGVQQNTGTIVDGAVLATFGIDVPGRAVVECRMRPDTWQASGCSAIVAAQLPPATNYVGAAVTPSGYPMAWATTVGDGGGGLFHWYVDYGGGWNGPRTGGIGGYNDASYVNVAFGTGEHADEFVLHAELVSGVAPSWGFTVGAADGDATSGDAVVFHTPFQLADGTSLYSTNDVLVDPETGDTHVLARIESGAVVYVHRPAGGDYDAPVLVPQAHFRARWVALADGTIVLVHGVEDAGLRYRRFAPGTRASGIPLPIADAEEVDVPLPEGYQKLMAIYTESAVYQRRPPSELHLALVGDARQNEVLHVTIAPP